ncbi:MAG: hypothetical protein RLZZ292_1833 [Bacteroidota bacterium]|jgi:predicted ATP-dependent endonuclease of OLD family
MHTHLTRVHLKGYRNIQDTETTFREGLNIIIGPNGCGKTNFLWLLANISNEDVNDIQVKADIEYETFYEDTLKEKIKESVFHIENKTNFDTIVSKKVDKTIYIDSDNSNIKDISYISLITDLLKFQIPLNIDCFSSAQTIYLKKYATYYTSIKNDNIVFGRFIVQQSFEIVKNNQIFNLENLNFDKNTIGALKEYTPIQDVRIEYPQRQDEIKENDVEIRISNLMYSFKTNNEWFKWNELSDGTRRVAWIVLNTLFNAGRIILIEEPELGIHPHQLARLMDFIKDQSEHKQIIMTTHSPEVLDILESDELDRIKIARYDETRGTTVIEGLSDKKIALIQKYIQKTGLLSNYWSNIGLENTKKSF